MQAESKVCKPPADRQIILSTELYLLWGWLVAIAVDVAVEHDDLFASSMALWWTSTYIYHRCQYKLLGLLAGCWTAALSGKLS